MSYLKRIKNVLKATVSDLLDKLEDKEKMLDLTIYELEEQKTALKKSLIDNDGNDEIIYTIKNDIKAIDERIKELKEYKFKILPKETMADLNEKIDHLEENAKSEAEKSHFSKQEISNIEKELSNLKEKLRKD